MNPKPPTYAELVRDAMRRRRLNRRDLEKMTNYSYEHVRKVVAGMPLMSEDFNDKLCEALGLDGKEMWRIAQVEKLRKNGKLQIAMTMPSTEFKGLWSDLQPDDQETLLSIAKGMALRRREERNLHGVEDDPTVLRQQVNRLLDRLAELTEPRTRASR